MRSEKVTRKKIDLTGQRFGRLMVIEETEKNKHGHTQWICKCECGREHIASTSSLNAGNVLSCGCLQGTKWLKFNGEEKTISEWSEITGLSTATIHARINKGWGTERVLTEPLKKDYVGERFNKLVIIEEVDRSSHNQRRFKCRCDCSNYTFSNINHLISGNTRSCGCLKNIDKRKDISGERYGRLIAIKPVESNKHGRFNWLLKCDCGNKTIVDIGALSNGGTQSCGCLKSELSTLSMKGISDTIGYKEFLQKDLQETGTRLTTIDVKNRKLRSDNTTGIVGVYWIKRTHMWRASIGFKGKQINLGDFSNKQDAINARKEAEKKYFDPILEKYDK